MTALLLSNLAHYIPELAVIFTITALLFMEACYKFSEKSRTEIYVAFLVGLSVAAVNLFMNLGTPTKTIFYDALVIDPFSTIIKLILVLGTLGTMYLSIFSKDIYAEFKSEFLILTAGVLVGGMLLASANNLLIMYLGIETLSILSYVLASLRKDNFKSSEAGLKYVLYGGISSGVMLFGISHIYGLLGTIQFQEMIPLLANLKGAELYIMMVSFLFLLAGIGYKISVVPFHMWAPDVYEGSPLPVTTFFAIVPKMAGMAALARICMMLFGEVTVLQKSLIGILQIVAILTMTVGNMSAIAQRSVKRMLAYSSIAHAGFMLLGVIVLNQQGISAIVFYGIVYLFMTLVAFYITSFVSDHYGNDDFDRFKGLIKRYPIMAIAMCFVMYSLTGLPPFGGFVAKFNVIAAVLEQKYYFLAFMAVLNSVVALYYYMRLTVLMALRDVESVEPISGFSFSNQGIICILTIPVVVLGVFWENILDFARVGELFIK